jgi:hypothetical protein
MQVYVNKLIDLRRKLSCITGLPSASQGELCFIELVGMGTEGPFNSFPCVQSRLACSDSTQRGS